MNRNIIKAVSYITALSVAAGLMLKPVSLVSPVSAELTQAELEQQKIDNEKKIEELQKEIEEAKKQYESIVADENVKLEYQDALNEKIYLQNENISVVVEQMNQIDEEIQETMAGISDIESQIKNQNMMIDANMELYKQRLRASYMAEGDTLSSVLAGSSSFLDILSKFEIVSKVAEHDTNLLSELESQLKELRKMKDDLGIRQEELNENLDDATEKKYELDERLSVLQADYDETQEELNKISGEKYVISENIEENEEIIKLKEAEQEKIDEEIEAIMEQMRQESIAASISVSESVSQSVAESIEESKRAEEEKKKQQQAAQNSQQEKPVTQAPVSAPEPAVPETESAAPEVDDDSSLMYWPVPGYTHHSSDFWDGRNHGAVDIDGVGGPGGAIGGAKVYAASDGVVASSFSTCTHNGCRCGGGYGNYVAIAHSDAVYSTYYAHLQSVFVSTGQSVKKGQLIGIVGNTGSSSGSHLHFEVRKNGVKTNPDNYSYQNYG